MKDLTRVPNPEDILLDTSDWNAEDLSRYPNHRFQMFGISSSWDCLAAIYILSHFGDFYWMTDEIYRVIGNRAYVANYQGDWKIVQDFLEQFPQSPMQFYDIWCCHRSPEEFFGNLKKRAKRLLYGFRIVSNDPPRRKPKHQERIRGYRDKGSLRLPHQYHGISPYSETPKLDLRAKIGHPILRKKEDFPGEDTSQ